MAALLLHLGDNLAGASTVPLKLEEVLHAEDAPILQLLQELSLARAQACGRECLVLAEGASTQHHLHWLERYLGLLRRRFIGGGSFEGSQTLLPSAGTGAAAGAGAEAGAGAGAGAGAAFQWVSPLACPQSAPGGTSQLMDLHSPLAEEIMALHMYAAVLQEQAHMKACALLGQEREHRQAQADTTGGTAASDTAGSGSPRHGSAEKKGKGLLRGLMSLRRRHRVAGDGSSEGSGCEADSPGRESPRSPGGSSSCSGSPYSPSLSYSAGLGGSPLQQGSPVALDASTTAAAAAGSSDDAGEAYASVAALYRRAAGVFDHIAMQLMPAAAAAGVLPPDGPVELWPGVSEVLAQLCMAQAQGVVAQRTQDRGASRALAAALHAGAAVMPGERAADLFQAACARLQEIQPPVPETTCTVSDRLGRFLSISATWHRAAAHAQHAQQLRMQDELGAAVACMPSVVEKARQALELCRTQDEEWVAALRPKVAAMAVLQRELDKERSVVYLQQVADAEPEPPAGRVVVTAIKYEVPKCA